MTKAEINTNTQEDVAPLQTTAQSETHHTSRHALARPSVIMICVIYFLNG